MKPRRVLIVTVLLLSASVFQTGYADCLPLFYLGTDPDDIKKDHIDIKELYYTINDTHITFIITCYGEIKTRKKSPTLPSNEFQTCLDVAAGEGDSRRGALFEGADIIIEAHNQRVYYWNGKGWERNKTASVQVEVEGNNITITCRLSDIQFERVSGDLRIGFISNLNKVGSRGVNKGQDRAPDSGWYTLEGGIPDLNLLESSAAGLLGFLLASWARRTSRRSRPRDGKS